MTTDTRTLDLDALTLKAGKHANNDAGDMCVMEAVAFVAGEPWSDHPQCASLVIGDFLRAWNDGLNDEDRQMLKPLIPRLVGTKGTDAQERARSWMALDWFCRVFTPAWLRLAGLTVEADAVASTAPLVDAASARAAQDALNKARSHASAAWDAARDAAGDVAGVAAGTAAWAAARAAAWAVTRDVAGTAAWAAARDAARDAAWNAAWAVTRDVAGTAARAAAWAAAWNAAWAAAWAAAWNAASNAASNAARDVAGVAAGAAAGAAAWDAARTAARAAARAAARDALRPTVEELQRSALDLAERMIAVTAEDNS